MISAATVIAQLGLEPLPLEGGFFRRTWTSRECLPGGRAAGSAIYFLLTPDGFSALHRLQTDELWMFHAGDPIEHVQLGREFMVTTIGNDIVRGHVPQWCVPAGAWQGARLMPEAGVGWALISCTMSPGWDDKDFELGSRAALTEQFPAAAEWIARLTR